MSYSNHIRTQMKIMLNIKSMYCMVQNEDGNIENKFILAVSNEDKVCVF